MSTILVTGGSGFLGSHCIIKLLADGHAVRATLRDPARAEATLAMLRRGGAYPEDRIAFHKADLLGDAGWAEAVAGCDYVLHVASPFPASAPKHEDELIVPAREGSLRVLRAARAAGVRRVVLTSSFGAVGYGHPPQRDPFTEADWTNLDSPEVQPYVKSKVLAERAAWEFVRGEGAGLELTVVNPVGVFGPALGPDFSTSIGLVKNLLEGKMRPCPRLYLGVVDVRDAAALHVSAMLHPAAAGERFIATAGDCMSLLEIGSALRNGLGAAACRVPTRDQPVWVARLRALWNPTVRASLPQLGKRRRPTSEKARRLLGWAPRSSEAAVVASGESLLRLGLVQEA